MGRSKSVSRRFGVTWTPQRKELVMSGQKRSVLDEDARRELGIRRMCDTLKERALSQNIEWANAQPVVQALIEGREVCVEGVAESHSVTSKPKRSSTQERQQQLIAFYRAKGFRVAAYGNTCEDVEGDEECSNEDEDPNHPLLFIPKPNVSNREFVRRRKQNQDLFWRFATDDISYEDFMRDVGQEKHWTVMDEKERAKIEWEPTEHGYWFWAEVHDNCPRLKTSHNDLSKQITLLSLEECVIVWHAFKHEHNRMIDAHTWCWLRTGYRFGSSDVGALDAYGYDGRVDVNGNHVANLARPCSFGGGRLADVVE
ncbi:MAG: hypothetical protein ABIG71_01445 [Candidatus Uhrbacteria bacterium]